MVPDNLNPRKDYWIRAVNGWMDLMTYTSVQDALTRLSLIYSPERAERIMDSLYKELNGTLQPLSYVYQELLFEIQVAIAGDFNPDEYPWEEEPPADYSLDLFLTRLNRKRT